MGEAPGPGRLRVTSYRTLLGAAAVGLVVGWFGGALLESMDGVVPNVPWVSVLLLLFAAGVLGVTAWTTWRTIHKDRRWIEPHRAVNYLVLGKASALVGAFVAGGYVGFGVRFLDDLVAPLPQERVLRSALAAAAAVLVVVTALLLERACRVPGGLPDEDEDEEDTEDDGDDDADGGRDRD